MYSKILALGLASQANAIDNGQAIFWEDVGHEGASFSLQVGHEVDFANNWWNDRISSFKVGSGVKLTLCSNCNCYNYDYNGGAEVIGPLDSPMMPDIND